MLHKLALRLLILCSFSLFLALTFDAQIQKSYFSVAPNRPFSYEFSQTRNGTLAHYFGNSSGSGSGPSSRYILFDIASGDAYPVLDKTVAACQITSPIFQHIHYHAQTDNLVFYCAVNSSLLFIDQTDHTVQTAIPLDLNRLLPLARLSTDGMNVSILAMDNLFTANPQSSILVTVNMQLQQVVSQILFDQNLTSGEAVVAYAQGNKKNYIATNRWQDNSFVTKVYTIVSKDNTHQIFPLDNLIILNSTTKTTTKLLTMGDNIVVNVDATLYFLDYYGVIHRQYSIQTKQVTADIFLPAVVRSTDGYSLYFHSNNLTISKYTALSFTNLSTFKDMQIAYANQTSNDLMFTYDSQGALFRILDLQTGKYVYNTISSYNDLMLTDTTYTIVQTLENKTTFYLFNLKTENEIAQVSLTSSKFYYNKDQHIITFLSAPQDSSCQVTHLDLISGKLWSTLQFSSSDICASFILFARVTEKGNSEFVIPGNQSYLIISETYGKIIFNTDYPATLDTDSININFDDLSFYYYTADQVLKTINASLYTFNPQSQSFQLNNTKLLNFRPVERHGFFAINQNLTVAISEAAFTLLHQLDSEWYFAFQNDLNLVTGFEDQSKTQYMFFSYFICGPIISDTSGRGVSIPGKRATTVSGQATGPRSFALYDGIYSSVGVVRFFSSGSQSSKTLISL